MSTTNDTTVKASRTITPIDDRYEYYTYGDLRLIHSIKDDYFSASSIIKALKSTKEPAKWFKLGQTTEILRGFSTAAEIDGSPLWYDNGKAGVPKHAYNIFMHRLLVPHFASWVSHVYAYKISIILDDHFELQRKVEENRALEDKNKSLEQKVDELLTNNRKILADNQELLTNNRKILADNQELLSVNRKMCNQLETIKVTLSTLVENVSELKNHVTSNKLCKYIIVLYKDEEHSDEKYIVIKPFCGLRENRPKIDKSDILFEREVSCSIDSFKEALSVLEERYIVKIHYRSMTIRRSNLEDFIDEFRVELRRRSTTITDVCDKLDTINDSISTVDSKVTSIDKRLAAYDKFIADYGSDYAFVKRVLDGEVTCKNKGKVYQLHLSMQKQEPYINQSDGRLYMPLNIFAKKYL